MHTSGLHTLPRISITLLKFTCSSLVSSKSFLGIEHGRISWVSRVVLGFYYYKTRLSFRMSRWNICINTSPGFA